jgi:hypothetical protein
MSTEKALTSLRNRLDARLSNNGCGIECDDGWLMLLGELDHEIAKYDSEYRLAQVKAKFGTLRFYVDLSDDLTPEARDAVYALIRTAEQKSGTLCELCGNAGTLRRTGWLQVRCDTCDGAAR